MQNHFLLSERKMALLKLKTVGGLALLACVGAAGSGCSVSPAVAPRSNIGVPALAKFPAKSVRLTRADLFLWPKNITAGRMARVLKLGDQMDDLETKSGPLLDRIQALNDEIQPLLDQVDAKASQLEEVDGSIQVKQEELKNATDPEKEDIQKAIEQLKKQKENLEADLAALKTDEKYRKKVALEEEQKKGQALLSQSVDELKGLVSFFDPPPEYFNFQFKPDGTFMILISKWILDQTEGPRDFSSKATSDSPATISDISYTEVGGRVRFSVQVFDLKDPSRLTAIFKFDVARVNSERKDGKTYFTGEMTKNIPLGNGQFEVIRGIAKFVDKNN
ncbi:MAG: hypothetical protein HYX41_06325 [Bdellovibrio sp.]|nr:hypothetical protein [Bdellovibrio sp.]